MGDRHIDHFSRHPVAVASPPETNLVRDTIDEPTVVIPFPHRTAGTVSAERTDGLAPVIGHIGPAGPDPAANRRNRTGGAVLGELQRAVGQGTPPASIEAAIRQSFSPTSSGQDFFEPHESAK